MDLTAVNVLLFVKVGDTDPTPILLVDVYYTLHQRYAKNGGMMIYYAHLLYKWNISHMEKDMSTIEITNGHKWAQYLVSLTEKNIIWYRQILHRDDIIISYGNFPNVPLTGLKGCINYKPTLAMRQLGHRLAYKPDEKFLEGFILQ